MSSINGIAYVGDTREELVLVCEQIGDPAFTSAAMQAYVECKEVTIGELWFQPQKHPFLKPSTTDAWVVIDLSDQNCELATIARLASELEAQPNGREIAVMPLDVFMGGRM